MFIQVFILALSWSYCQPGVIFLPKMILKWFAVHSFRIPVIAKTFMFAQIITIVMSAGWLTVILRLLIARHIMISWMLNMWKHCLGINEVVLTSLLMANRIFPCVLTPCFLLNYFSSIILSDYKTCNKFSFSFVFLFVSSYLWFSYQPISPNFIKSS